MKFLVLTLLAVALALPVQAKPKIGTHQENGEWATPIRRVEFSAAERYMIRSHLMNDKRLADQQAHTRLPKGLQKKVARGKTLPPGWQKKIAPGEHLDYSIYRQGESLPDVLLRRLSPPPPGTEILQVEDQIMILDTATRAILDVFDLTQAY